MELILGIIFLAFSNANFQFDAKKLTWKSYITTEALSTTNRIELINKREFAKIVLDKNSKTFVIHISALQVITIHLFWVVQIAAL